MVIPLWAFIVAMVVFLAIVIYQYIQQKKLEEECYAISYVLDYYVKEYGGLTVNQLGAIFNATED